jgi:hypothetical protein
MAIAASRSWQDHRAKIIADVNLRRQSRALAALVLASSCRGTALGDGGAGDE